MSGERTLRTSAGSDTSNSYVLQFFGCNVGPCWCDTSHSHRYETETAVLTDKDNEEQSEECEHDEPRLAFLRLLLTTITGLVTLPLTPTSAATNPEIKKTTKVSSNKKLYFRTSYARSVATLGSLSSRRNAAGLCARSVARKEPR